MGAKSVDIEILLSSDDEVLNECALLMSQSEPFSTLLFDYEKCKLAVRGDYKEVYIAWLNGQNVGFVVLQFYGLMRGYIQSICVSPLHRSMGIGTSLLLFSEEKLLKQFPNVFMCVTSFNHRAQKLYYSLGYEKVGTLTNHIIQGADEYILRKQGCPTSEFKAQTDIITTKVLTEKQSLQINELWNEEYPIKLKDRFPILLTGVEYYNHYLILDALQNVIAWAVDFEKEKELRFSIIVSSKNKGKGLGTKLIEKLKTEHKLFFGWVIDHNLDVKSNGEPYLSPLSFYTERGFEVLQNERIESEMIKAVKVKWQIKS